jgi:hypothetical protein
MQPGHALGLDHGAPPAGDTQGRVQAAANTIMQQYLMSVYGGQRASAFGRFALEQKIEVRDAGVGISMLREAFGKP